MTRSTRPPFPKPHRLALACSAGLHALLVLALFLLPSQHQPGPACEELAIDTRVSLVELRLVGLAPAPAKAASPAPPAESPSPVVPVVFTEPARGPTMPAPVMPDATPARLPGVPPFGPGGSLGGGISDGRVTFFEIPARARSIVYVIDRSGSMGQKGYYAVALRELSASLEQLPADVQFQVIAYNRGAAPLRLAGGSRLAPATEANKREAAERLEALPVEGGTNHLAALREALALQPEAIFFLTDADDMRAEEVRLISRLNRGLTAIHAIGLGRANRSGAEPPLEGLARANRGLYRQVDPGR